MGSIIRLSSSAPPRKPSAKPVDAPTVDPNDALTAGGNWPFIQGTARARAVKIAAKGGETSGTTTTELVCNTQIFDGGSGSEYAEDPGGDCGLYNKFKWAYSSYRDAFYERDTPAGQDYEYVPRLVESTTTTPPHEINSGLYGVCIPIVPDSTAEIYGILAGGFLIADFASDSPFAYDGITDYAVNSGKLLQGVPAILSGIAVPGATTGDGSQDGDMPSTGGNLVKVSGDFGGTEPWNAPSSNETGHAAFRGRFTFDMTLDLSGLPAGDDIEVIFAVVGGDDEGGDDQLLEFEPVTEPDARYTNPTVAGPYLSADGQFAWALAHRSYGIDDSAEPENNRPAVIKYNAATGAVVSDTPITISGSVTGKSPALFSSGTIAAFLSGVDHYDYIHVPGGDGWLLIWVECNDTPFNDELCVVDPSTAEIVAFLDANIEGGFGRDCCWQKRSNGTYFVAWVHADSLKVAVFDPAAKTFTLWRDKSWSSELFNVVCQRPNLSLVVHPATDGRLFLDEYDGGFNNYEIFQYDPESDTRTNVISGAGKIVMRMWVFSRSVYIIWDQANNNYTRAWIPGEGSGGETHTINVNLSYSSYAYVNSGTTQSILVVEGPTTAYILLKGDAPGLFYYINFGASTPIVQEFDFSGVTATPLANNQAVVWYGGLGCGFVSREGVWFSEGIDEASPVRVCIDPQLTTSAPFTLGWITEQIGKLVGFTSAQFDREDLTDPLYGATLDEVEFQNYIRDIREVFDFTVDDHDGVFHLTRIPSGPSYAPDATLTVSDLVRRPDANAGSYVHWERAEEATLPHAVEIEFYDPARLYVRSHVTAVLAGENISPARTKKFTIPFAILERDAIKRAYITLHNIWAERVTYDISVRAKQVLLTVGDVVRFPLGDYAVDAKIVSARMDGDEVQNLTLQGIVQDKAISISANPSGVVIPSPIANQGSQYIDLNIPMLKAVHGAEDRNDWLTQYHTVAPTAAFVYPGGRIWRSQNGEFIEISVQTDLALMGTLTAVPTQQSPLLGIDNTNTMTVQMLAGMLDQLVTVSQASARAGGNRAAVGKDDRWQIVYFTTPNHIGGGIVEITGIYWGQEGTEVYVDDLQQADWFILLNDKSRIKRQVLAAESIAFQDGESVSTRTYKATGLDQHPVAVESITRPLRGYPEKPYAPWKLAAEEIDGSPGKDLLITWSRRDRVPPSGFAQELPMSETSDGSPEVPEFFVEIIDNTVSPAVLRTATVYEEEYSYQASDNAADFSPALTVGDSLTVRVRQVARFRDLTGTFIDDAALYGHAAEETVTIS